MLPLWKPTPKILLLQDADEVAVEDDDVEAINPPEDLSGNIKVEEDVEPGESDSKEEL